MLKKIISILLAVGLFLLCCSGCSRCSNKGEDTDSAALNNGSSNSPSASQSANNNNTAEGDNNTRCV